MTKKTRGLPEFIIIGADDHPLGKRSIWLYEDGSVEGISEAYGMKSKIEYGPDEGVEAVARIREAYADHDEHSDF